MERYIAVKWPESQKFQDIEEVSYDPVKDIWFVPEKNI